MQNTLFYHTNHTLPVACLFTNPLLFVSRMKIDIHFSLIAAAVTYIMWKSVGEDKIKKMEGKKLDDDDFKKRKGYWRVDCQSASKGKSILKIHDVQ